jgi:hypothetical protein
MLSTARRHSALAGPSSGTKGSCCSSVKTTSYLTWSLVRSCVLRAAAPRLASASQALLSVTATATRLQTWSGCALEARSPPLMTLLLQRVLLCTVMAVVQCRTAMLQQQASLHRLAASAGVIAAPVLVLLLVLRCPLHRSQEPTCL